MTEMPDPDQIADEAIASDGFHVIDTDEVEQLAAEVQQVEAVAQVFHQHVLAYAAVAHPANATPFSAAGGPRCGW